MPETEKAAPDANTAARALMFACLLDNTLIPKLGSLAVNLNVDRNHRSIFSALDYLHDVGTDADIRNLVLRLKLRGELERVGGVQYICSLDLDDAAWQHVLGNWGAYVEVVASGTVG